MKFFSHALLALLVARLVACAGPNFIVLFTDDQGYADLSCYGHPSIITPNIDRLAEEGIKFTQWYSAGHVCSPSRAGLLTGRYPVRSGCAGAQWRAGEGDVFYATAVSGFPHNETTIAEELKAAGYDTSMVGKWHLGQRREFLPPNHGFDSYFGIPFSTDMGGTWWYENLVETPLALIDGLDILEQPVRLSDITERYTDRAVEFITRDRENPFFLFMSYQEPHTPHYCSEGMCDLSPRGPYGDAMLAVDRSVGRILEATESIGKAEDTLIFFVSDNGPWLIQGIDGGTAGLLRNGKGTTWDGGIRVPGLAYWPGHISPGQVITENIITLDIFTTALTIAGIPLPSDRQIDGVDLSPLLFGESETLERDCLYFYMGMPDETDPINMPGLWAMRCGAYKAHFWSKPGYNEEPEIHIPYLIFNLDIDPSEEYPLDPESQEYQTVREFIEEQRLAHVVSVERVPNWMALGINEEFGLCCDPDSQDQYPEYPRCTCDPENWETPFH